MADDTSTSSPFGGLGWISGGSTGLTYEQLQQRRAIALALASRQKGFPKNKGEGMTYLGESIGDALQALGLQRSERAYLDRQAAAGNKPVVAPAIPLPADPNNPPPPAPDPKKTSDATAVVPPVTTADNAPTDTGTIMQAATEARGDQQGVPNLSQFAAADVSPDDFGSPAAPTPFPPSFSQRFAGDQTPPPVQPVRSASTVPPVSIDPNMKAELTGGNNVNAFARTASTPVPVPGTPLPQPRPDMPQPQTVAANDYTSMDAAAPPAPAPNVPLPRGDPRTVGGVRATVEATGARGGMNPNAIAGLMPNIRDESGFNAALSHWDPTASERARGDRSDATFSHGLYQERGEEWAKYKDWVAQKYPDSDWRDPKLQTEFLAQNLQTPQYQKTFEAMQGADRPGTAAASFVTGYLKPAEEYRNARVASYLGGGAGQGPAGDTQVASYSGDGAGVRDRAGNPVTRDNIASLLMSQPDQALQQPAQTASADDTAPDARLLDVAGANRRMPGSPFRATASLGRAGVASDAPQPGLSPMGALDPTGSINARRDAITGTVLDQQRQPPVPEVPQPDPTQSGPTAPSTPISGAGSSNPPTATDIMPAPPMGATAQAGVPLGGYPSVPTLAQPAPTTIAPRPPPQQIPDPQQDPQYSRQTGKPIEPTYMVTSPLEAEGRRDQTNPYTRGDPSAAAAAQAKIDAGARQREQYNSQLKDRYDRQMNAWQEEQKTGLARKLAEPERRTAQDAAALELQNKQFEADLNRRFGGRDKATVYAELDADKSDAQKNDNILRQAAIAKEAIKKGIITGAAADQQLALAKLRAKAGDSAAAEQAANTEAYKAAVDSMLRTGVENLHGGAGKPGVGSRVTSQDIEIARGGTGNPELELKTINKLIAQNEREAREKINNYESKTENLLSGLGGNDNALAAYRIANHPTAPDQFVQRLLQNPDENTRNQFDRRFGTGAAELEIARAQRAARRGSP